MRLIAILGVLACGVLGCPDSNDGPTVADFVFLDDSTIFAAAKDGRFIRSENLGESWSVVGRLQWPATWFSRSFRKLEAGAQRSIWGLYDQQRAIDSLLKPTNFSSILPSTEFGLSRDDGASFGLIETPQSWIGLIEQQGADPLMLDYSGILWRYRLASENTQASLEEIGTPAKNGFLYGGIVCNEILFVFGQETSPSNGTLAIWLSKDAGRTWVTRLELTADIITAITCSPSDEFWSVSSGGTVFRYDFDMEVFTEIAELGNETAWSYVSIASDGESLYVSRLFFLQFPTTNLIFHVLADGTVEELSGPSIIELSRLRVDAIGNLWAAGEQGMFRRDKDAGTWKRSWPEEESESP